MDKLITNLFELSKENNKYLIFNNVQKQLNEYSYTQLLTLCNEFIKTNNIIPKRIENCNNFYEKFYLCENEFFSLILIKWNKNCESKIHDHPEKGCIMRILHGELSEEIYTKQLNRLGTNELKLDTIGYKIGTNVLHKIIAIEYSISIHIYIPGYYTPNYY